MPLPLRYVAKGQTDRWPGKAGEVIPHVCLSNRLVSEAPLQCVGAY